MQTDSIGVLVLAAGASTRLGRPKQTLLVQGETLLDRSIRTAKTAGFRDIVVVLGAFTEEIRAHCELDGCRVLVNPDWKTGMGSSISLGVSALEQRAGVVVMTCDMPFVTVAHLVGLTEDDRLTASRYSDANGVPAYFPNELFASLLSVDPGTGAKSLLRSARTIELEDGSLDIDTPEDVKSLEAVIQQRADYI